jgi:hypothetical protein
VSRRRSRDFHRTENLSPFGRILERLIRSVPGCRGAAFVDHEGEAVDVAGYDSDWDIKVAGAHIRILLDDAASLPAGAVRTLVISTKSSSYFARVLPEGYAIAMVLGPRAAFEVSERAVTACAREFSLEAGFDLDRATPRWFPVEVSPRGARSVRPRRARAGADWHDVDVLGTLVGLRARERAYRVRLGNGAEVTLLREPLGRWWSDDQLE